MMLVACVRHIEVKSHGKGALSDMHVQRTFPMVNVIRNSF